MSGVPFQVSIILVLWIPACHQKICYCYHDVWLKCRPVLVPIQKFMLWCRSDLSQFLRIVVLIGEMPRRLLMHLCWLRVFPYVSPDRILVEEPLVIVTAFCMICMMTAHIL